MPAQPKPAIARPMMSAVEFGAVPQMIEPISKMIIHTKKVHLTEKTP
jgi:hypothetical protein